MENFFGEITPALLITAVTVLIQVVKETFEIQDRPAKLLSLGLSYFLLGSYHIIQTFRVTPILPAWEIAWVVFTTLVYPLFGWFMATGIYHEAIKPGVYAIAARLRRPDDDFPR